MNTLIEKMAELSPEFGSKLTFTPKLVKMAADQLGVPPDWKILKRAEKLERGVYRLSDSSGVQPTPKKVGKRPPAPALANSVAVKPSNELHVRPDFCYIPPVDPHYIPFGPYKDVESIIKSRQFFPVYITGHSGNGKSSQVIQACAKNGIPLIRIPINSQTDEERLIGSKTLQDGNVSVIDGPVLIAMRTGATLLLEELDAASPSNIMCLQTILEGKPYYFSLTNEYIDPAPGFNIIATGNTKGRGSDDGRYNGTNVLNDAFLERFPITIEQEYPTEVVEKKIVLSWMGKYGCEDVQFATELVTWAQAIRKTFDAGGVDDLISTRRLEHAVRTYSIFRNKQKTIEMVTARFNSINSESFRLLFSKIAVASPVEATPA